MSEAQTQTDSAVAQFKAAILAKLRYAVGKDPAKAFDHDWFEALALATRDHMIDRWEESSAQVERQGAKRVYYLSLEFLIGRFAGGQPEQSRPA